MIPFLSSACFSSSPSVYISKFCLAFSHSVVRQRKERNWVRAHACTNTHTHAHIHTLTYTTHICLQLSLFLSHTHMHRLEAQPPSLPSSDFFFTPCLSLNSSPPTHPCLSLIWPRSHSSTTPPSLHPLSLSPPLPTSVCQTDGIGEQKEPLFALYLDFSSFISVMQVWWKHALTYSTHANDKNKSMQMQITFDRVYRTLWRALRHKSLWHWRYLLTA